MNPIWTDDISTAEQIKENSVYIMTWYITHLTEKITFLSTGKF